MEDGELAKARQDFRDRAIAFWELLAKGDAVAANCNTDLAEAQVERWAGEGTLLRIVRPLLMDEAAAVRYAAAALLLHRGVDAECERVLEDLQADAGGLIAPTARLLLLKLRQRDN